MGKQKYWGYIGIMEKKMETTVVLGIHRDKVTHVPRYRLRLGTCSQTTCYAPLEYSSFSDWRTGFLSAG